RPRARRGPSTNDGGARAAGRGAGRPRRRCGVPGRLALGPGRGVPARAGVGAGGEPRRRHVRLAGGRPTRGRRQRWQRPRAVRQTRAMAIDYGRFVGGLAEVAAIIGAGEAGLAAIDALVSSVRDATGAAGATFTEYGGEGGRVVVAHGDMAWALGQPI